MMKRTITAVLVVTLILSVFTVGASAAEIKSGSSVYTTSNESSGTTSYTYTVDASTFENKEIIVYTVDKTVSVYLFPVGTEISSYTVKQNDQSELSVTRNGKSGHIDEWMYYYTDGYFSHMYYDPQETFIIPDSENYYCIKTRTAYTDENGLGYSYDEGIWVKGVSTGASEPLNIKSQLNNQDINVFVQAGEEQKPVRFNSGLPYVNEDGRTMVALRAVADAMGLEVSWNQDTQTATFSGIFGAGDLFCQRTRVGGSALSYAYTEVHFKVGSNTMTGSTTYKTVSGKTGTMNLIMSGSDGKVVMDTVPAIKDGKIYAPIKYLAKAFEHSVVWDPSSKTVILIPRSESYYNDLEIPADVRQNGGTYVNSKGQTVFVPPAGSVLGQTGPSNGVIWDD